jgi:predicted ATPase/class 3 adenylate cyclase
MDYDAVLAQVLELLQREKRLSYRVLKRRLGVDDDELEDLKEDLIYAKKLAVDEAGHVLVWTGSAAAEPPPTPPWQTPDQAPLTYTPPYLTEKILASRAALEGERKQVTVLFADLKDSTELIRGLDPEAAQQLLDPAIHRMMDAVHRFEGTVNQVLGDGIMALFGAPLAHEDHALRACYAGLAMQAAMHGYTDEVRRTHGLEMRMRVGLNSGEVVVRAIGNDLHMDYSAVGETTHLAARMEQLATPGSIRLTAATLRLVEGLVRVNVLGPVPVKGVAEPVEVFELIGATAVRRRLQATAARGLTPFVGRHTELVALQQALEQAAAGHGQIVAVVGEAGVGKSRLVYEFVHTHRLQGWRVLESASVSYGKATPYFPVIDLLRRYCHVEEHDDTRTVRAKVTGQMLTLDEALQETIPALLALLEALPADSPFVHLDPSQRRQLTLEALKRLVLRESQVQPLLLVFEDLHWIDAETQALLGSLVESLPTARLLLLVNYRPEYQHGWGSKTYYTQLRLDPLPPQSAEAFLQALLGGDPSLAPLKQLLTARTEGNPFFLEESVRTLVETGVLVGEPGAYRLVQARLTIQVPATVQAVLAARIDRLPPEDKRLLQTAAVIGTEVPLPLLQAIAELPDEALQRGLTHLQAAEFLYETGLFPERVHTFKHALTHEVAYGGLLQERRRTLHTHIVAALEALAGDRVADQVERLAHHALRGEVWEKAVAYCRQAGDKALARSANREAVACYEHALSALQHLPESRSILEQGIDLRFDLRNALYALAHQERILTVLREAEALAEALDDPYRLGQVAVHMGAYFILTADPHRAIAVGERAGALATTLEDATLQLMAQRTLGLAYCTAGAYPQAIAVLKQAVAALTGARARAHFGLGTVLAVTCRRWLGHCLAELGAFNEGLAYSAEALRLAEAVGSLIDLALAYFVAGELHLRQGCLGKAIPPLERSLTLCQTADLPTIAPTIVSSVGYAYALAGRFAEALPLLEQAVEQVMATRLLMLHSLQVAWLGEAYLLAGRIQEATAQASRALDLARARNERGFEVWALRLCGEIAARREPPEVGEAEARYREALALAEALGMRPLQAHCHRGLGTLYSRVGRVQQARIELSPAIQLYQEMEMTFWLPQVEAARAQAV